MAVSGWLISCASVEAISPSAGEPRHVRHFRLQLLQPVLGKLLVGQVADETCEVMAVSGAQFAHREMHREGRSVLALAHDDAANADDRRSPVLQVALDIGVVLLAIGRRHQEAYVMAASLVRRVAEQALRGRAERFDAAPARR
jgi:hypothetical protein